MIFRNTKLVYLLLINISLLSYAHAEDKINIGAVASADPLATKAGLDILEKGGNAFDAAIAIASTLNVVEPAMSGLGGYGSTIIYIAKNKEIRYLNSTGKFPIESNADLLRAPTIGYQDNRKGPKSISTPSILNGWKEMHTKYGQMHWNKLFDSAIFYAQKGVAVRPFIAELISSSYHEFSTYSKSFYGKNGSPLKEGELLIQQDLANTYKLIAEQGISPFYRGNIAIKINNQMKKAGSFLSLKDLHEDVAEWEDPISINYKGYDIYTTGTPGNAFTMLFTLGVLKEFDLQKLSNNSIEYIHLIIEVLKESSKARRISSGSIEEKNNIENHILTESNFKKIAESINLIHASNFDLSNYREGLNTTHFVVVDKWGNIVSSTQTLGTAFGSKVMIEGTGIWMNNSMYFSTFTPKGNPMDVFPGKHKLSSNSPTIIMKEGKPWAVLGTPGGHTIPQNIAQIIINLIDFNMNMQESIDTPKVAFFDENNIVITENGIHNSIISKLRKKGHIIANDNKTTYIGPKGNIGNAMGIKLLYNKDNNLSFEIGVDKRRDGWYSQSINNNVP